MCIHGGAELGKGGGVAGPLGLPVVDRDSGRGRVSRELYLGSYMLKMSLSRRWSFAVWSEVTGWQSPVPEAVLRRSAFSVVSACSHVFTGYVVRKLRCVIGSWSCAFVVPPSMVRIQVRGFLGYGFPLSVGCM